MSIKSIIFNVDQFKPSSEFAGAFTVEDSKHSKNYATFSCRLVKINLSAYPEISPVFYKLNRFSKSFTVGEKHRLYKELTGRLDIPLPPIQNLIDLYALSDGSDYRAVAIKFW